MYVVWYRLGIHRRKVNIFGVYEAYPGGFSSEIVVTSSCLTAQIPHNYEWAMEALRIPLVSPPS